MSNAAPDNMKMSFDNSTNSLKVSIIKTGIQINANWKYKVKFVSVSGNVQISGTLDSIGMGIGMTKAAEGTYFIPQIGVNHFALDMNKGAFSVKLTCHHCPGEVEKLITKFMKGKMLDQVKNAISSQTPSMITTMGNNILKTSYPWTFTLYDEIDITTALTKEISVQSDHLEIPLDGTIFLHSKGYARPGPAPVIPTYNPKNPGEVMMFISPYLIHTLADTLNLKTYNFTLDLFGHQISISIDPGEGKTAFEFEEDSFNAIIKPTIMIPSYNIGIQLGANVGIHPKIDAGDDKNMMHVTPLIRSLSLNSLKIKIGSMSFDLSYTVFFWNLFIQFFANYALIPKIAIPKHPLLPLHVTGNQMEFHKTHSEVGILFNFGL